VLLLAFTASASANPPDFLLQMPETQTAPGAGAGELDNPRSIAADPDNGHVYIADRRNARVSEYTAWGWFVKAWGWGVTDGSSELQTCGPAEPQSDPGPSLCQKGLIGTGKGQFGLLAGGMAVDGAGSVWVGDLENLRVQKFNSSGLFQVMFGGDVNKTKVEEGAPAAERNRCPVDQTDVCQAGVSGEDPAQIENILSDQIAYSPTEGGRILVGDKGGIQVFDLEGNWVRTIAFSGPLAVFVGQTANALDVDGAGNIYFSLSGVEDLYKLDSTGMPVAPGKPSESLFKVDDPVGVGVDIQGNVYAIDDLEPGTEGRVLMFDPSGNKVVPTEAEEDAGEFFPYVPFHGPNVNGLATNVCAGSEAPGNLYVSFFIEIFPPPRSYVNGYGPPPIGCEDPPPRDPEVLSQFATSVGREEATVKAQINPLFWPDTTYYVEYGTGKCSGGGCPDKAPVSPPLLTDKSINAAVTTAGVVLEHLLPNTTYNYRFVAESGGGGPVFGIDPDGREGPAQASESEGLEATFKTARPTGMGPHCPNDAVRVGESAKLPDCRAYEMVSPLDKGGGDVATWEARNGVSPADFEIHKAAHSGNRFTYTSWLAFGEAASAPWISQHLSGRGTAGWASEPISPPRTESPVPADFNFDDEYQGFTEDLCRGWVRLFSIAPLTEDAIEEYPNLYRRENCAEPPAYEAVTTVKPENRVPGQQADLVVWGFSTDGSHVVFGTSGKMHPDAPELDPDEMLLYEHTDEGLRFVCYLPNGEPSPQACAAGTLVEVPADISSLRNAVSEDGSRIFWTDLGADPGGPSHPGQIYVRVDGAETKNVSTTVADEPAFYWTASDDGSKAVFEFGSGSHQDELYEVDVDTETPTLIAGEVEGPMGASEDASRIYFASKEDLDDTGPAVASDHNLYLYEADPGGGGGEFTFVMAVPGSDIGHPDLVIGPETKTVDFSPRMRAARVSPDGQHVAFMSVATPTPTGYDNLDAESGQPAAEVYLYDAAEGELVCVSCNASGARPTSDDGVAARIQGWETRNHAPRVLSDDGTRVFFESFEALVPRDTNGTWDVYQWEEENKGTCTDGRETFNEDSGGCVNLISSGLSSAKSTFLDADPSGDNIFFSTQSSLVGQDYGLNDVYVARVGGGFPEPQVKTECEGEACQSPPPPPPEVTPSTETAAGPGNVPQGRQRKARRCPKGKRKVRRAGKVRCVKRKAKARATKTRRPGR
jgi:hypothetical protein